MKTKIIETPIEKHKIELKTFFTGGEKLDLEDINNISRKEQAIKLIELTIISIDDKKENILKAVRDMHGKDFDFLQIEIGKIANNSSLIEGSSLEEKKNK